jgi:type I restriction enzyme M protein
MALKKSELYSSLWSSCDELCGGMDASQHKDYVLVLLFIKYVSDKIRWRALRANQDPPRRQLQGHAALKGSRLAVSEMKRRRCPTKAGCGLMPRRNFFVCFPSRIWL